ncbi:MAG: hypothetical protein JXA37_12505 [Chloroflexia bacterium]|nr:hypothetical protein [Chloroflexia bacterium]
MKMYRCSVLTLILLLVLSIGSCGETPTAVTEPTRQPPTQAPTSAPTQVPPTQAPTSAPTQGPPTDTPIPPTEVPPTAPAAVGLGQEPYRSEEAGFSIAYPEGWIAFGFGPIAFIAESEAAMDADVPESPMVVVTVDNLENVYDMDLSEASNSDEMVEFIIEDLESQEGLDIGRVENLVVGGEKAAAVEVSGIEDEVEVSGSFVAVHLGDRGAIIIGIGTTESWNEFRGTFEAMMESVTFFAPTMVEPTVEPQPTEEANGEPPEGFLWRIGNDSFADEGLLGSPSSLDLNADGSLLYAADFFYGVHVISTEDGSLVDSIGGDELFAPSDVKVGPDGNIYVADWGYNAILVYAPDGTLLHQWGESGAGDGQFGELSPDYLAVCPDGRVYAADTNRESEESEDTYQRVLVFDSEGEFLDQWMLAEIDETFSIYAMDCGPDGNVYMAGLFNDYILVMDGEGNVVDTISDEALDGSSLASLALGPNGNLYFGTWDGWIGVLDTDGNLLARWGSEGDGEDTMSEGEFYIPDGIAVDDMGSVYVSDETDTWAYITKFYFPDMP